MAIADFNNDGSADAAPGSYVTICGARLAGNGSPNPTGAPLPLTLNGTQVLVGGSPVPLAYAGPAQINALMPQSITPNASWDLLVVSGSAQSAPQPVTFVELQPAIFTLDDSGAGQGAVLIAGTTLVAGSASGAMQPAVRGKDYLEIYCTGLGEIAPANGQAPPADGTAAPLNTLFNTAGNVAVTIGGVNAPVVFAGLSPGSVALYQVDIAVPAGAPAGDAVPVVLTVTNPADGTSATSNTVSIALQ